MNPNLNEIALVLDASGSMQAIRDEAIQGVNKFMQDQRLLPGRVNFTMVLFNYTTRLAENGVDLNNVPDLTLATYQPNGMTALYDAIGKTIDSIGERLAKTPEEERPAKVIIAIMTDGHENASKYYTFEQVSRMILRQREQYNWDFIFLGANMDAVQVAVKLNMDGAMAASFAASPDGIDEGISTLTSAVTRSRTGS